MLAIAVIIIVLFSILGLGLVTLNASASKQFTNKEQQVQARHFAEMGLVYYKNEAEKVLKDPDSALNTELNHELARLNDNALLTQDKKFDIIGILFCEKLTGSAIVNLINTGDSNYEFLKEDCKINVENTSVDITVKSKGTSKEKDEIIKLNLSVNLPEELITNNDGSSTIPLGKIIEVGWPCTDKHCGTATVKKYTDISQKSDSLFVQKGNLLFLDSLVVKNLEVGGGKTLNLTIEKNFTSTGTFKLQNHACVIVKGDFNSLDLSIQSSNVSIYISGDAYFGNVNFKKNISSTTITVIGDVYINNKKQIPKPALYNSGPNQTCSPGIQSPTNNSFDPTFEYIY